LPRFLVLGAGFTGSRVIDLLKQGGFDVHSTNRNVHNHAQRFDAAQPNYPSLLNLITPDTAVLHSIPTLHIADRLTEITPALTAALRANPPARLVYLSTTGVYGTTCTVDEHTAIAPRTERELLRVKAERAVRSGPWNSLVLRPAAIYGPGRGIHAAIRAGTFRLPEDPSNFVSRIHVDDLAAHAYAALLSDCEGEYPVADEEPCTSYEAARFCSELLGLPIPPSAPSSTLGETRRADRRVDGSAIRKLLGVSLQYPSYKTGFPACLESEARLRSMS